MLAVVTVDTVDDLVDFSDDFTSLREAVLATNLLSGPDEIQFDFGIDGPVTLVLTEGQLAITDALTIRGDGADLLTIDGNGNRIFHVDDGEDSTDAPFAVVGATLTGSDVGHDQGGAIRSAESLTIESSAVLGNVADRGGAGIFVSSSTGGVTIVDSTLAENRSDDGRGGGALISSAGNVEIIGSSITDNLGENGGGAYISSSALITIRDNVISRNVARGTSAGGGGLSIAAASVVSVEGNTFTFNRTDGNGGTGGALRVSGTGLLTISGNSIMDNWTDATSAVGGGMALYLSGSTTIVDNQIIRNRTEGNGTAGGGLYVSASGILTVGGNTIADNRTDGTSAQGGGAAIVFAGGVAILENEIARNHTDGNSTEGGGIYLRPTGTAWIARNTISHNSTDGRDPGHGIFARAENATIEIIDNDILENTHSLARGVGGIATRTFDSGAVVISGNRITGNDGGIVVTGSGSTTVSENSIVENNEVGVTLIASDGARIQTERNTITSQSTDAMGRGMDVLLQGNRPAFVSIIDTTIAGNRSVEGGGGLNADVRAGHTLEVSSSTISGNSAGREGGGIWLRLAGGSALLEQVTVSGNSAMGSGGGTYLVPQSQSGNLGNQEPGELTIRHSTITQNFADLDGSGDNFGGGVFFGELARLSHTIVAGNNAQSNFANNVFGTYESSFNLIDSGSEFLGPLADNGGLTQTHALLPGSPAIDRGDPSAAAGVDDIPARDQRGRPSRRMIFDRIVGQIDVGAYEVQVVPTADFDSDGDVDGSDFLIWQRGFGIAFARREDGNSDDDRDVDASDLAAWQVSYGQPQAPAAIAEMQSAAASQPLDAAFALEWSNPGAPSVRETRFDPVAIESVINMPEFSAVPKSAATQPTATILNNSAEKASHNEDLLWLDDQELEQVFG